MKEYPNGASVDEMIADNAADLVTELRATRADRDRLERTRVRLDGALLRCQDELARTDADLSVAFQVARERAAEIVKVHDWWASLQISEFEYFKSIHVPGKGPV